MQCTKGKHRIILINTDTGRKCRRKIVTNKSALRRGYWVPAHKNQTKELHQLMRYGRINASIYADCVRFNTEFNLQCSDINLIVCQ